MHKSKTTPRYVLFITMSGYMHQVSSQSGGYDPSVFQECRDSKQHPMLCAGYTDFFKNSNHDVSVNEQTQSSTFQYVRCAGDAARRDQRSEKSKLQYKGLFDASHPIPTGVPTCGGSFVASPLPAKKPQHRA